MTVSVNQSQQVTISTNSKSIKSLTMSRPPSPGNSSGSETEPVLAQNHSSTALRRLYFKSARMSKTRGPNVPKVVVMGSSTSETSETINTSTESASTHFTNITTTDTETETFDSLDLVDSFGQDPLLSSLDEPSSTLSANESSSNKTISIQDNEQNSIVATPETSFSTHHQNVPQIIQTPPHTAPVTSATQYSTDVRPSFTVSAFDKLASVFKFEPLQQQVTTEKIHNDKNKPNHKNQKQSSKQPNEIESHQEMMVELKGHGIRDNDVSKNVVQTTCINSPRKIIDRDKQHSRAKMQSAPPKYSAYEVNINRSNQETMFPFDREAIDYDRIQKECFIVEDNDTDSSSEYDVDSPVYTRNFLDELSLANRRSGKTKTRTKTDSPVDAMLTSKQDHRQKLKQIPTGDTVISSNESLSALPNLRIDFFNKKSENENCLDSSQKLTITANPLENQGNEIEVVCTQPRATIVVQQASLSLDYSVETVLLKNDVDFIGVEGKEMSKWKLREDLLDISNRLTIDDITDFDKRYKSPHHNRSQSVKSRPNQLCLPQQRSRVASMPNTGVEEEYYRLRHFSITGKGVVNRGDSLKQRSKSNLSVASSNSSTEHLTAIVHTSARNSASSHESSTSNPGPAPFRVLMLGGTAVGKSSLVSQFMTSEYLHAYDTSIDDESGEKSVSVLLSGEESELIFIDHSCAEISPENCLSTYDPHGYCVIYSSADKSSFSIAERILQLLWTSENIAQKAVILVANKADLARSRIISSEEGKAMATAYDCKFIETSVGINHNVDELLVGLLSQIRLKLENPEKSRDLFRKRSTRKPKRRVYSPTCLSGNGGTNPNTPIASLNDFINTPPSSAQSSPRKYRGSRTSTSLKVKGLLGRVWARDSKSKSCENLHVL